MYSMVVPFALVLAAAPKVVFIGFDSFRPGTLPAGWTARTTHSGDHPLGKLCSTNRHQAGRSAGSALDGSDRRWIPTCDFGEFVVPRRVSDRFVQTSIRCRGSGCGHRLAFQRPDNYYIVRANAFRKGRLVPARTIFASRSWTDLDREFTSMLEWRAQHACD